jgi:asparagine synthase (glutamine-hydrolysing)
MTAQPIVEETQTAGHDWIVAFEEHTAVFPGARRHPDVQLLFDGVLYNGAELTTALPELTPIGPRPAVAAAAAASDDTAALLTRAYRAWGAGMARRLRGTFALVIWDRDAGRLLAIRDPLGAYPLFHARGARGRTLISPSLDALARHPHVDRVINRAAVADHLCHRWPSHTETFYRHIARVPPGCWLQVDAHGTKVERYFDPAPLGQPVKWITEDELEGFDACLETAVSRAIGRGRPGIFLSGGLDSISVAAVAAGLAGRGESTLPLALSLGFPHGECNEEPVQRGVARTLGLEQEFVRFFDAIPSGALLGPALECTRRAPAPILNTWTPAYTHLTRRGQLRGVDVILTGSGGDEWLSVSPYVMADMMRAGDVAGTVRILNAWRRSYRMSPWRVMRGTWWTFGARPLAGLALHRIAPSWWHANRVARLQRTDRTYVGADPALVREQRDRAAAMVTPADPPSGFYFQEIRSGLDHLLTSMELEETFEMGRSLGVRFRHPYWDADVVDLLYRTPPALLIRRGRAKGLVRDTVAKRFPNLGLDRQKKVASTSFFQSVLRNEVPGLWRAFGGAATLAELGVVDQAKVNAMVDASFSEGSRDSLMRVWELLNLDAWVASHS